MYHYAVRKSLLGSILGLSQIVPSGLCMECKICCRFPDQGSSMAPVFLEEEMKDALKQGMPKAYFGEKNLHSARVKLIAHQAGFICPCFSPKTNKCILYSIRPLDCRLYPFIIMRGPTTGSIVLGIHIACPYTANPRNRDTIKSHAAYLAEFLQSPEAIKAISTGPLIIGPYQEDVTILHHLERLMIAMHV
jgi:Fe-S-cluster containining protein